MLPFDYRDSSLSDKSNKAFHLSIQILPKYIDLAFFDLAFRKYQRITRLLKDNSFDAELEKITLDYPCANLSTVSVSCFSRFFCLIPDCIYHEENNTEYLQYCFNKNFENKNVFCKKLNKSEVHCIFSVDNDDILKIQKVFPEAEIFHTIHNLNNQFSSSNEGKNKKILINVVGSSFEIFIQNPLFYNIFEYKTAEDFLYYTLFAMQSASIDIKGYSVYLSGEIEAESQIFVLLQRYINNISLVSKNPVFEYSSSFSHISLHQLHSILNQSICEL